MANLNKKIAILGAGNMGAALLKGIVTAKLTAPNNIIACDIDADKLKALVSEWQICSTQNIKEAVEQSEIILLCVKPQMCADVLKSVKQVIKPRHLIISIVAGMRIESIQKSLLPNTSIVRTMPNIAATISEGATAIAFGEHVSDEQKLDVKNIMQAVGEIVVVNENQIDAVTGLSGSGPAYIFMVIEAMIDGGVKMGLSRDVATTLAIQTVIGAAQLVKQSQKHPAVLKDQVATPGGTTIAAIHELESHGLRAIFIDAITAATRRSEELNKKLN